MYGNICSTCKTNIKLAKNIKKLPFNDRPYEKLELMGEGNLTNSELLAIIIKTGTKKYSCLDISQKILSENNNITNISDLEYLTSLSIAQLKRYEGIGRVKAIQIKAVLELAKRISNVYKDNNKNKIRCPKDAFKIVFQDFLGKKQEILKTIILNKNNDVLSIITNYIGNCDKIDISLKEVLSEPIKQMAHSVILVHNHPSGNLKASLQDRNFTNNVIEYAQIFDIKVLDHIIISNNNYFSFKENNFI